ncbi:uncharacterized protein LOC130163213 [Seriola aureovittata]|uniref:uncharacterized protein LOC130163213 n=1 Tax=Seriola aureovittata TaxID=2871759 RepID=UPI0024BEF07C|nr:uncharacterized protein LOC130163213 [Seriola aureovittata]
MGNLLFSGLFRTDATVSEQVTGGKFIVKRIRNGITYYYAPRPQAGEQTYPAKDSTSTISSSSPSALPLSDSSPADPSSCPLLSDSPSHTPAPCQNQSDCATTSRPLLLFFSWLGAQPGAVAKYRDLYLDRGMDVLLVQSGVMHFLWPQWGLDYGLQVLKVLDEPQFSGRAVLVHASSIGGYTFTQMLTHIAHGPKKYAGVGQRVIGHIYDSLVAGSLEHMAVGLGKTLVPRLEGLVKNTAMLYFWLFKAHTADFYDRSIQVFNNSPITAPALFFFSENDALCNPVTIEKTIDLWRKRSMAVESRKWKESVHAAHMRCHPQDYISTLEKFLKSLPVFPPQNKNVNC